MAILSIALLLPPLPRTTGISMALMAIFWFTYGNPIPKFISLRYHPFALLSVIVYVSYVIGMLFTENDPEGLNNLVLKISFLAFPVIFFTSRKLKVPELSFILQFFLWGCILASLLLLSIASYTLITSGINNFFYGTLTSPLGMNPSVFAMYLLFCIFFLLQRFITGSSYFVFRKTAITWLLVIFFMLMILLLSARQEIIASLLFLPALILINFTRKKKWVAGIGISAALVGALLLVIFLIPETKMRMEKMQEQMDQPYSNDAPNSVSMRKVIWETAFEIIRDNPFTGVGTGDVNDELKKRYKEKNLIWPLNDNLNAHNQYLQTAMAVGLPGLLLFVFFMIACLRIAITKRHYLYILFLLLFLFCIITECMLEVESGVVFFTFFNSLLARDALNGAG